jgi:leucyl-tRNA synthetase
MLERLGADDTWPTWDDQYLTTDTIEVVVQINGKLRARLQVDAELLEAEDQLVELALADAKIKPLTSGKTIIKTIVVPHGKLINLVIK